MCSFAFGLLRFPPQKRGRDRQDYNQNDDVHDGDFPRRRRAQSCVELGLRRFAWFKEFVEMT